MTADTQTAIRVTSVGAGTTEIGGGRWAACWKGLVGVRLNGLRFTHTCGHRHRKPEAAQRCADAIARKLA